MDRDIPAFNQLVMNKINQKNLYMHEQRLQNIRSSQNSRAYLSTSMNTNTRQNRKAHQLQQDKKTQIEKHNIMLFNKMKKIMNRPDPHNRPLQQNSKNNNRMSMEFTKIQEENRNMYERIERQRPTISNKRLFEQRQKHLNILKFLGKYSSHSIQNTTAQNIRNSQASSRTQNTFLPQRKKAYTTKPQHYLQDTQTDVNTHMQSKPRYDQVQYQEEIADDDFNRMRAIIEAKRQKRVMELREKRQKQDSTGTYEHQTSQKQFKQNRKKQERPSVPRSAKDITLYKTTKEIDSITYQIRILRKHLTYEIRCNETNTVEHSIKLEISEEEGTQLLQQKNYDYRSIIDSLRIVNRQLYLADSQTDHISQVNKYRFREEDIAQQTKSRKNNKLPFSNPSHISQLNEEDSYQYQTKGRHQIVDKDDANQLDSLGQQEQFEKYTTQELSESQNNLQFIHNPGNFEQKLQQLRQNNIQKEEYKHQISHVLYIKPKIDSQVPDMHEQEPQGLYEQALDEEID